MTITIISLSTLRRTRIGKSYPHPGTWRVDRTPPRVFDVLQYFEAILPSVAFSGKSFALLNKTRYNLWVTSRKTKLPSLILSRIRNQVKITRINNCLIIFS